MTNTINPADCDRTTVYAGECRNFQDTEWITFNSGRRRSPNARDGNTWLIDVANGSFWMTDDQVRNLVRLVPARPITRQDLPDHYAIRDADNMHGNGLRVTLIEIALDAVVEHLNTHYPKPEFEGYCTCNGPDSGGLMGDCGVALHRAQYRANLAEADADRWRRAHEIVEGERDQARETVASLCERLAECSARAVAAEARAECLERGIRSFVRHGQAAPRDVTTYDRDIVHAELLALVDAEKEPAPAGERAEAAEARPAVTREDAELVEAVRRRDAALRAVLDRHPKGTARAVGGTAGRDVEHCLGCRGARGIAHDDHGLVPWPCPTVRAVTASLGEGS